MPRGRYSLRDPQDHTPLGEEHFQCAVGPAGWRYAAQLTAPAAGPLLTAPAPGGPEQEPHGSAGERHTGFVDLTLDRLGRPLRLELRTAGWQVRGGALDGVTWVRTGPGGARAQQGNAPAQAFTGRSPAFLIATARLLRLTPDAPVRRTRLVAFTPPVLAPRTLDQTWTLLGTDTHTTDSGPLLVEHYRVGETDTGESHAVHIAGDVVLAAPGIELEDLESPPSAFD